MMFRFLALISAIAFAGTLHAKSDCTVEGITNACKTLSDKGWTQFIKFPDGTWFRNPEYDNSKLSWITNTHIAPVSISEARQGKLESLVNFAKDTLIEELKAGREDNDLSPEVKNQIGRIRHIHYDYAQSLNDKTTTCRTLDPNAYFSKMTNSLVICRSLMMIPDAGVVAIIGHELCHSISPCALTLQWSAEPAIDIFRQPWGDQIKCLRERGLADPYPSTKKEYTMAALKTLDESASQDQILAVSKEAEFHPACFSITHGRNPDGESIPDLCGGKVAAKYLKAHPPKDALEKLALLSPFIDRVCGPPANEIVKNGHLITRDRLDKIYLADPEMSEALGCKRVINSCLHDAPTVMATPNAGTVTH